MLARNQKELKEIIKRLEEQSVKRGLCINEKKIKYMEWTEEEYQEGRFLKVETNTGKKYEFEEVEQFTYLGSIFSRKPNIGEDIEARIMAGNRCFKFTRRNKTEKKKKEYAFLDQNNYTPISSEKRE
ncbi:hypothetical protein NQ315_008009 [Exocentrus adspersus]|uniref:Uncharacterized protein n=1 Tax=Exocentrus adspersus TaxID=1586481 RepID=A0AAV8VVA4_9CUCU|nr:hypothetical protein NQ315_008009 [Exocentrus adspersus]